MSKQFKKKARLLDWAKLVRWENTLFALACLFVGFRLSNTNASTVEKLLAYIVLAFSFAGGNALNDALDSEIDNISHRNRPIPSGKISRRSALALGWSLLGIGLTGALTGSFFWGIVPSAIAVSAILFLIAYNLFLKKITLIGNLTIASLGASVFIFTGAIEALRPAHLFAVGFAFLIQLSREIVKDIQDLQGDTTCGIATLPSKLGDRIAAKIASVPLIVIVLFSIVPYFMNVFSIWYLGSIILLVDLPLLLVAWSLPVSTSQRSATRSSFELKLIMVAGLFAILIGAKK